PTHGASRAPILPRAILQPATLRDAPSLLHLAEHCPKLQILEMMVDASTVPPIERSADRARVLQDALSEWTIGLSLLASPLQFARFLSAIFPELEDNNYEAEHSDDEDGNEEAWSMWRCSSRNVVRFDRRSDFGGGKATRGVARNRWRFEIQTCYGRA
ncbi:hypothetical protein B0H16DRAFT_1563603, partial [Mycena metata]